MRHSKIMLFSMLTAALALAGCSLASGEPVPASQVQRGPLPGEEVTVPVAVPVLSEGAAIFADDCEECHGADGAGGVRASALAELGAELPDMSDFALAADRTPQEWFTVITNGTIPQGGLMPQWSRSLNDAERWSVAYYVYTLSMSGGPEVYLDYGQSVYEGALAACYGENGDELGMDESSTATSQSIGRLAALISSDANCAAAADLSEDDLNAAATYILMLPADTTLDTVEVAEEDADPAEESEPAEAAEDEAENEEEPLDPDEVIEMELITGSVSGAVELPEGHDLPDEDVTVTLRGVTLDMSNSIVTFYEDSAVLDDDGAYSFEEIPLDVPNSGYIVTLTLNGREYSNGTMVEEGVTEFDIPVVVLNDTTDPGVITVDSTHLIVTPGEGNIEVMQLNSYSNASDAVFTTDDPAGTELPRSVGVSVPFEASGLEFQDGAFGMRYIPGDDGMVYDTQPVYPGDGAMTMVLRYLLPSERRVTLELMQPYDVSTVSVMVAEGMEVINEDFAIGRTAEFDGVTYTVYNGRGVAAGEDLVIELKRGSSIPIVSIIGIAVAVGALGGVVYLIATGALKPLEEDADDMDEPENGPPASTSMGGRAQELVAEIQALDQDFAEGRINRIEYEAKRAELKRELARYL